MLSSLDEGLPYILNSVLFALGVVLVLLAGRVSQKEPVAGTTVE